jgi:RP/EB family microtubule-associated protein
MSTIGLMEGAFFVGRKEILDWINNVLSLNLQKIEDTANGAVACQLLDIMYPGKVPMNKLNWSAKQSFEFVANYKILQTCFTKMSIERHIDVDRLITGKYMDNLEFMQWFKRFFEMSVSDVGDYDAYGQRCKGKGTAIVTYHCSTTDLIIFNVTSEKVALLTMAVKSLS